MVVSTLEIHSSPADHDNGYLGTYSGSYSDYRILTRLHRGMQGAGHNFGIVTSFELKIYPKKLDTWHYHNYIFTQDKLEPFFDALNTFHNNGSTPVLMALNMGGFAMDPSISETEVCVSFHSRRLIVSSYVPCIDWLPVGHHYLVFWLLRTG